MSIKKAELKDRLQYALDLREKKAVDLSKDLNIPKSAISQYLSGRSQKMDTKRLYSICNYLDVSEPWMLGFDVPMDRALAKIEEKPVETANKLADMFIGLEFKEEDPKLAIMIDEYKQLDESRQEQVREYVHFLLERS